MQVSKMPENKEKKSSSSLARFVLIPHAIGFIVMPLCFLYFMEKEHMSTVKMAQYMSKATPAASSPILESNNKKMIVVNGSARGGATLLLDGVEVQNALNIRRTVEMYQWKETRHSGGEHSYYTHDKVWFSKIIDSEKFRMKQYVNPVRFPLESKQITASSASLGDFTLTDENMEHIKKLTPITNLPHSDYYHIYNGKYYYSSRFDNNPEIGDIRISYAYVPEGSSMIIIAEQQGNYLVPQNTRHGTAYLHADGITTKKMMLSNFERRDPFEVIFVRVLTFVFLCIGTFFLFPVVFNKAAKASTIGIIALNLQFVTLSFAESISGVAALWVLLLNAGVLIYNLRIGYKQSESLDTIAARIAEEEAKEDANGCVYYVEVKK